MAVFSGLIPGAAFWVYKYRKKALFNFFSVIFPLITALLFVRHSLSTPLFFVSFAFWMGGIANTFNTFQFELDKPNPPVELRIGRLLVISGFLILLLTLFSTTVLHEYHILLARQDIFPPFFIRGDRILNCDLEADDHIAFERGDWVVVEIHTTTHNRRRGSTYQIFAPIIGLPGEHVSNKEHHLYVDNEAIELENKSIPDLPVAFDIQLSKRVYLIYLPDRFRMLRERNQPDNPAFARPRQIERAGIRGIVLSTISPPARRRLWMHHLIRLIFR